MPIKVGKLPITRSWGQTDVRWIFKSFLTALLGLSAFAARASGQSAGSWLSVDSAAKAVSLRLDVTFPPGASSALISGHHEGDVQIVVPRGWTVAWQWESHDSTAPHSLVLMAERERIPTEGGQPAIDYARTNAVTTGLKAGSRDVTQFKADQVGWYWLLCGVPGHGIKGEWIGFKVDADATAPALVPQRSQ
jgi:hypothetical protein